MYYFLKILVWRTITLDIYDACIAGDNEKVLQLVNQQNVNAPYHLLGETPLYFAISNDHFSTVSILLQAGADVNQSALHGFFTPLIYACARGSLDIATLLLQYKADPNIQDARGNTPLHSAAENGWADIVLKLLEYKAKPNIINENRDTPLHLAAAYCRITEAKRNYDYKLTVKYLLSSYEADSSAENLQGETFLTKAKKKCWSMPPDWESQLFNIYQETQSIRMLVLNSSVPTFLTAFPKKNDPAKKTDEPIPTLNKLTLS